MLRILILLLVTNLLASCELFEKQETVDAVARVGNTYLLKSDIAGLVPIGSSIEDSTLIVNNYINRWAKQQLLIEKARVNLSQEKLNSYDELVKNYRADLYIKGYKDAIATVELDSTISRQELENYYNTNKENFLLNEDLIKLRYIHVGQENTSKDKLKKQLFNFDGKDRKELQEKAFQFKTYSLNDSVWVKAVNVTDIIPPITNENKDRLLKKSNNLELQDSLGVYLIHIKDVLLRNQPAPLQYVSPTIEQIILNKRKLEIIQKLEKDIIQDAIRNKKFETFD